MPNKFDNLTGPDASTTIGPFHKWFLLRPVKENLSGELNRWVAFPFLLIFVEGWVWSLRTEIALQEPVL